MQVHAQGVDNLPAGFIKLDQWRNACERKGTVPQCSVVLRELNSIHAGTCTRSRLITYRLDSSSWINGGMHVKERVQYHSAQWY